MTALAMKVGLIYAVMRGHRSIFEEDLRAGISVARYCSDVALELPLTRLDTSRGARMDERILGSMDGVPMLTSAIHLKMGGRMGAEELRRELDNLVVIGRLDRKEVMVRGCKRTQYWKVNA
jgi:hypothetical protein